MVGPPSAQELSSTTGLNVRREPRAACGTSVSTARLGGVSFTNYLLLYPRKRSLTKVSRLINKGEQVPFAMSVTRKISARLLHRGAQVAGACQFNQLGEVIPRLIAVAGLCRRLRRAVQ